MVDPLIQSGDAFAQDLRRWVRAGTNTPGARRLDPMRVVLVCHLADSPGARAAIADAGLPWPERARELHAASSLLVARRQPEEVIVTGDDADAIDRLLAALVPGRAADALAFDLTHGLGVVELHGPRLDDWLAHVVDASAIPAAGGASRCRLVGVAV